MGLTLTDSLALVTKGYKTADIKELKEIIDKFPDESNNIIELAKKMQFSDLKSTIELFYSGDDNKSEDQDDEKTDNDTSSRGGNAENENDEGDDQDAKDDVDYKKMYEEEKNLRTQLQRKNQNSDISGRTGDNKTDEEIALQFATDVLN